MAEAATAESNTLTFEQGMTELDSIVENLEKGGIAVSKTVELCRRGKALEQALRTELESCEGELKRIEAGEGLPAIRIAHATEAKAEGPGCDVPADTADFETADATPLPPSGAAADDDIPF